MAQSPNLIEVEPVPGRRIMRHDRPGEAIVRKCMVPRHPHYYRAIARGDLREVKPRQRKKSEKTEKE